MSTASRSELSLVQALAALFLLAIVAAWVVACSDLPLDVAATPAAEPPSDGGDASP